MEHIYGRHAVRECLRAGRRKIHRVQIGRGVKDTAMIQEMNQLAQQRKVPVNIVSPDQLALISDHTHGVALIVEDYPYVEIEEILAVAVEKEQPPFILILDTLQDPQNLGALIRAAEAAGVHGVIITDRRSAGITPAVVHASSGATEHLQVAAVGNLVNTIKWLKQKDVWVGAMQEDARAQNIYSANLRGALALVVGNEGDGVRRLVRDSCDFLLRLPMYGKVESLNAATAGSIAIYEALRQRTLNRP
jgi:23S rRNA (guanosine2251-2'-O)-methyltransferase